MTREETLDTAKKMVCGHREQDYGTPENNFQVIADLWNVHLQHCIYPVPSFVSGKVETKVHITPFDVAIMMSLFKHGRIISGSATDDSLVDACGYLACGSEIKSTAKESLKKIMDLNQEGTDKKEESKKPSGLKGLILKTYGDKDGYIACYACPISKDNGSTKESTCPYHGICTGLGDAVDHIYYYLKDKGEMAILETMLKENEEINTVNLDDRCPGSGAKLY